MNWIVTLAIGDKLYGELALNLAASIKANTPNQKILIIYNESAIASIKPLMDKFFDAGYIYYGQPYDDPAELSFYLKTHLFQMAKEAAPQGKKFIFLDADTIMVPGRTVDEWFEKHDGKYFASYCNDHYEFGTGKRRRKDYTFWCDPEKAKEHFKLDDTDKLPQINSSFLYWNNSLEAEWFFKTVQTVWNDEGFTGQLYKGCKPDEMCFNIACAIGGILPSEKPTYRPIFFQFASEVQALPYLLHYYKCFGFAGIKRPAEHIISFYNEVANYYRVKFGIASKFEMKGYTKVKRDENPIEIKPVRKHYLHRAGDVEGSAAGIFNPDGVLLQDGSIMTIYRKEKDMNAYKVMYTNNTAIPHVDILGHYSEESYELEREGYGDLRLEDFRLFRNGTTVFCNHKIIFDPRWDSRNMATCLAYIQDKKLLNMGVPDLPLERREVDINWMFFMEGNKMWCVYQLYPYRIFYSEAISGWLEWKEKKVEQPESNWFHTGQYICNSTNPVLVGNQYLMFFHTKESGIYYHGAVLIDKDTKEITCATKNSITIKDIDKVEGLHKHLLYVSGCVYFKDRNVVRIYFGEADYHSTYHDYDAQELLNKIIENATSNNI